MERQGQIVFSSSVPKAFNKAFENEPLYKTDPTVSTVEPDKDSLLKIWSDKPDQYEDILEAYANAPEVSGKTMIDAANDIEDIGEIEVIREPLPPHLEAITRPFKRGQEYFLRRPERRELIYVGPKQLKSGSPVLQAPADLKKAA